MSLHEFMTKSAYLSTSHMSTSALAYDPCTCFEKPAIDARDIRRNIWHLCRHRLTATGPLTAA